MFTRAEDATAKEVEIRYKESLNLKSEFFAETSQKNS
jgi:hypothetical protein